MSKFHPNLKIRYFKLIDTKEKAYWLGFLYADGYIETRNSKPFRLGIEIDRKDEILVDRFMQSLGLNPKYKKNRKDHKTVLIRFVNKFIVSDLLNHGVIPGKSKKIELPVLENDRFYLAFLLGFFDGDGKVGTTRIVSGSIIFLKQIKDKFNLSNKIYEKNSPGFLDGRLIAGHGYSISLGVNLFRKMLRNYSYSLPRKRYLLTQEEKKSKIYHSQNNKLKKKFKISKELLTELVWILSMRKIGLKFNVDEKTVKYWCIKWDIKLPPMGYWNRKKN